MAHEVFISYSSKHRELTRRLAAVIEGQYGAGSVWWDHELESRAAYTEQIKAALESARVIVVVWTADAMISNYVYAEAVRAQEAKKLVNVRPADLAFRDVPEPFNVYHVDDAENHQRVLATIANVISGKPIPTRVPLCELYYRQHGHRIIETKSRSLARNPADMSPTELLQAKFEVVPFVDVTNAKAAMLAWCTDVARATAGRLVHGPGGLGKTRLLIAVATALREHGWTAGFLDRPHEQVNSTLKQRAQALEQLIDQGDDAGLLIVMDYAEGRLDEIKTIAKRLANRTSSFKRPIRLVLLTRGAGDWWTSLHDETPDIEKLFRSDARSADIMPMPSIATGEQRLALFTKSVEALAPLLQTQGFTLPSTQPVLARLHRIETGECNARPLAIQMEALLYLTSATPDTNATGIDALLRQVLGIERDHWRKLLGSLDDDRTRDISRGIAQVTAVQGVNSNSSAERLLMADDFYKGVRTARVHVDPVLRSLARVYGRSDGGITHLEPDLIGEHHVANLADAELIEGCLRWIASEPEVEQHTRRRDLVTVLQRATQPEHGPKVNGKACALLENIIHCHAKDLAADIVAVAVDTPGSLPTLLFDAASTLDEESLAALSAAMPGYSLRLDAAAAAIASARVEKHPDDKAYAGKANKFRALRRSLQRVGRHNEALAAAQEALRRYRVLAGAFTSLFWPDLAECLCEIAKTLGALGRLDEALTATHEAVTIYRSLTTDQEAVAKHREIRADSNHTFLTDLARCLDQHGDLLLILGQKHEALLAKQEAVDINRTLATDRPDAVLPDLADSLKGISGVLSELDRCEDARAATQEAVDIFRSLVKVQPDVYRGSLATSLNTHCQRLIALADHAAALAATREALDIQRSRAKEQPDSYLPDLAEQLTETGSQLTALDQHEEALASTQEATAIFRSLVKTKPDVFLRKLATSLQNTGGVLLNLRRYEEALLALNEALDLVRLLGKDKTVNWLLDSTQTVLLLERIGSCLVMLGRYDEALPPRKDALEIIRSLAKDRPGIFLGALEVDLDNFASFLNSIGRNNESLAPLLEALELKRSRLVDRTNNNLRDLALVLDDVGNRLHSFGHSDYAAAVTQEAVGIYRELAENQPEEFLRLLSASLYNVGIYVSRQGRNEEALAAMQSAIDIQRSLAIDHPDALPLLAQMLLNIGSRLGEVGRRADALATVEEAILIRRSLAKERPDVFLPDLARSLNAASYRLLHLGHHSDALRATQEAVEIYRNLTKNQPDTFLPDLANSLDTTADVVAAMGRQKEVVALAREALSILEPLIARDRQVNDRYPELLGDLRKKLA